MLLKLFINFYYFQEYDQFLHIYYKFTYTCKCMDINLDRNLSAYLRLRILFFNCVSVIKKNNPSFYYAKSVPKNHILTDFVFLKF